MSPAQVNAEVEIISRNGWQIATAPARRTGGFQAWARRGAIQGHSIMSEPWNVVVVFAFRDTRATAVAELIRQHPEIGHTRFWFRLHRITRFFLCR
jgi:hypothetical protein